MVTSRFEARGRVDGGSGLMTGSPTTTKMGSTPVALVEKISAAT